MSNRKFDPIMCSCNYDRICKHCFVWEDDITNWNPEEINTASWLSKRHESCNHEVMIICDYCVADIKRERMVTK